MNKLCPVIEHTETKEKLILVKGKLLTKAEAIREEIYFGYIDVAPITTKAPISTIRVLYGDYTLTEELVPMKQDNVVVEDYIPEELLAKARREASGQQTSIGLSVDLLNDKGEEHDGQTREEA